MARAGILQVGSGSSRKVTAGDDADLDHDESNSVVGSEVSP